jgi:hypothetical protein
LWVVVIDANFGVFRTTVKREIANSQHVTNSTTNIPSQILPFMLFFFLSVAAASAGASHPAAAAGGELSVLFIGNSYTYYNGGVPAMLEAIGVSNYRVAVGPPAFSCESLRDSVPKLSFQRPVNL